MSIWYEKDINLDAINALRKDTISEVIGLEFTALGYDFIKATIPVDNRTKQPFGILHGGASAVLAETLGSVASYLCVNPKLKRTVGLELNCNHIKSVTEGIVTGTATPIHIGGSTQVWDIKIHNEAQQLICISRLTVMVINNRM